MSELSEWSTKSLAGNLKVQKNVVCVHWDQYYGIDRTNIRVELQFLGFAWT